MKVIMLVICWEVLLAVLLKSNRLKFKCMGVCITFQCTKCDNNMAIVDRKLT